MGYRRRARRHRRWEADGNDADDEVEEDEDAVPADEDDGGAAGVDDEGGGARGAVARLSWFFRYYNIVSDRRRSAAERQQSLGALKYDPVANATALDAEACERLQAERGVGELSFEFLWMLAPRCQDFRRKVMAVPSIGCPPLLSRDPTFLRRNLHWAQQAARRPTILVVHASECEFYKKRVSHVLAAVGVGLVAWNCREGVVGFGVSRLAAQQAAQRLPYVLLSDDDSDEPFAANPNVVLCDVNVRPDPTVAAGHLTDDEGDEPRQQDSTGGVFAAAGGGTGRAFFGADGAELKPKPKVGGDSRPLEQVVTVGDEMLYDPCFITSSEDADLTNQAEWAVALVDEGGADRTWWRADGQIRKMETGAARIGEYVRLRTEYLSRLVHEEDVVVEFKGPDDDEHVRRRVRDVVRMVAGCDQSPENLLLIRSLIIEKILLDYKLRSRGR